MSNLTSASGDASGSSGNKIKTATNYPQQYLASQAQAQAVKKKRNQPGNPDPDAEVIALSPKTLLATNRFVCEICNKGFQREQNLQLHRRGHNLPWNLKQRTSREIRKKVYVCPEPTCVHHDPSRALGDLTGIKKHFCRKHGEKKWKCDKCSKKYAVQSDWKAHSKTCGTKEHRCDCGTLFSRRDSFVTHRAFCDAIAEERGRAITGAPNPILSSSNPHVNLQIPQFNAQDLHAISLKAEQQSFGTLRSELPPWLACPPTGPGAAAAGPGPGPGPDPGPPNQQQQAPIDLSSSSSSILSTTRFGQDFTHTHRDLGPNPNPSLGPTLQHYHSAAAPPHMSATALLQKAAQMGATISSEASTITVASMRPHHQHQQQEQQHAHVSAAAAADDSSANYANTAGFCLNLSSREGLSSRGGGPLFVHGLAPLGNQAGPDTHNVVSSSGALLQDMVNSLSSAASGFERTPFDDAFSVGGVLNPKKDGGTNDGGGGNEGLTRDFLGLRPLSHSDILNLAVLGNCVNTSHDQQHSHQSQTTWQGNCKMLQ